MRMICTRIGISAVVLMGLALATWSHAQESAEAGDPAEFAKNFWSYLHRAQYRNWAPAPGVTADYKPGLSPHGKYTKLYANRVAYADMQNLPYFSILLVENYDSTKKLQDITVLYRSRGTAPDDRDWFWIKYLSDGTVATSDDAQQSPLSGRVQSCIDCHRKAKGDDFVFANDE